MDYPTDSSLYASDEEMDRGERAKLALDQYKEDIRRLMQMVEFKRVINHWLRRMGLFSAIWRKGADVHNSSSRHDAALEIYRDLVNSDESGAEALYEYGVRTEERGVS